MPIDWVIRVTEGIVDFQRRAAAIGSFWPGGSIAIIDGIQAVTCGGDQRDPLAAIEQLTGKAAKNRDARISRGEAVRVFGALCDAAVHQNMLRLPELFCGFNRRPHRAPTPYPVACAPQAWAAGAVFGLLGAVIGLELKQQEDEILFSRPVLPDFLEEVVLHNISLGTSLVTVRLNRRLEDVAVNILSRIGSSKIMIAK